MGSHRMSIAIGRCFRQSAVVVFELVRSEGVLVGYVRLKKSTSRRWMASAVSVSRWQGNLSYLLEKSLVRMIFFISMFLSL